jgi:hypothetical protein
MSRYLIQTPNRKYTGDLGSVHFHLGQALVDKVEHWLDRYCAEQGYSITDTQPPAEQDQADDVPDDDGNDLSPPPGNASADAFRRHVLAIGKDRVTADQVKDLNRDQLRELAAQLATPTTKEGPAA